MYSGWLIKWRINRSLTPEEKDARLPRDEPTGVEVDDRASLVALNSTYAEFIDRRFRIRGGFGTTLTLLMIIGYACLPFILYISGPMDKANMIGLSLLTLFLIFTIWILWWLIIRKEFFASTNYPIRFNRKTRQIYVFRDKRDGGILTIPWGSGFFHIGQGIRDKRLLDMRCHVLDGDTVKDTFPTGHFYIHKETVQQLWEFIRTYMDEGPEALRDTVIVTSPATSWRNCFIMASASLGAGSMPAIVLLSPFIGLITLTRWLVMKTCKAPQWPSDIEAACHVEPNDPYQLPEPAYTGQLSESDEAYAKLLARREHDKK